RRRASTALPDDRVAAEYAARRLGHSPTGETFVGCTGKFGEAASAQRFNFGDHDRARPAQVPAKCGSPLAQYGSIGEMAGHELVQTHCLEAVVGLGNGTRLN